MPQLDALRAFAVGGVLIHHLYPTVHSVIGGLGGFFGVKLFFVLSGFLITLILLDGRTAAAAVSSKRNGTGNGSHFGMAAWGARRPRRPIPPTTH